MAQDTATLKWERHTLIKEKVKIQLHKLFNWDTGQPYTDQYIDGFIWFAMCGWVEKEHPDDFTVKDLNRIQPTNYHIIASMAIERMNDAVAQTLGYKTY